MDGSGGIDSNGSETRLVQPDLRRGWKSFRLSDPFDQEQASPTRGSSLALEDCKQLAEALVARGGPCPQHYVLLDAFFTAVHPLIKNGRDDERRRLQSLFGRAMTQHTLQGFVCERPHGYPGDFEIMDRIYTFHRSGDPQFRKWDDYFHAQSATKAVRNRKAYFHDLLRTHQERKESQTLRVLKIACGPGRSMREFLESAPNADVRFECVEKDAKAIAYASALNSQALDRITFINRNVFRYEPTEQFDLIWAAGICDYFSDRAFEFLLQRLYPAVARGGEIVLGNFSPRNPSRSYMEFGGWFLNHRTASDLLNIASRVTAAPARVSRESEAVNLFLHIESER